MESTLRWCKCNGSWDAWSGPIALQKHFVFCRLSQDIQQQNIPKSHFPPFVRTHPRYLKKILAKETVKHRNYCCRYISCCERGEPTRAPLSVQLSRFRQSFKIPPPQRTLICWSSSRARCLQRLQCSRARSSPFFYRNW